jgi:hypothetical protein
MCIGTVTSPCGFDATLAEVANSSVHVVVVLYLAALQAIWLTTKKLKLPLIRQGLVYGTTA